MIYLLLLIFIFNLFYIIRKGLYTSTFIIHFFFVSLIFIGPPIYYELGFTTYAHSFDDQDLVLFEIYGISVFFCTLVYFYFLKRLNKSFFNRFFQNYRDRNVTVIFLYFVLWYTLVLGYLLFYFNELPLTKFVLTGHLPDRLDQSGKVKLFYTFSSFFMVFVPSGYFFFIKFLKSNISKILMLLLVIFILTSGGHKGLVSFFVIFALFFSGIRFNFKYLLIGLVSLVGLLTIYTLSKGREFNKETFFYLLESPPRRFFVTQGSAFITRISLDRKGLYEGNIYDYQVIKRETFQFIYPSVNEKGAAPTIFLGDLHVRYGYFITMFIYVTFLIFTFFFIKGTDNMDSRRLYLWWNIFIFFYLLGMAEISYTSVLRMILVMFNFAAILFIPYLKLKNIENKII
ncbi:hypothetical protein KO500_05980 [Cellulophaga baltica]|uniref:hypothetical protein n=1 Tax=Cellulophaga TaxID=104264 RepID=UPI001C07C911|nr:MULTISPECIES: hypothetical protein [Cellulophaga]MBU2995971.1 hypothetical protein [Cellulophaga baltica]MDO6767366.1 hypothetical protein [Cellulophaga sp. 1_MG-2023]